MIPTSSLRDFSRDLPTSVLLLAAISLLTFQSHRNIKTQGITSVASPIEISIYFEMNRQPGALTSSRLFLEVVSAIF